MKSTIPGSSSITSTSGGAWSSCTAPLDADRGVNATPPSYSQRLLRFVPALRVYGAPMKRRPILLVTALAVLAIVVALPTLAAEPSTSPDGPGNSGKAKKEKVAKDPITVDGTVASSTDAEGEDDVHDPKRWNDVYARGGAVVVLRRRPSPQAVRRQVRRDRRREGGRFDRGRRRDRQRHGAARGRQAAVGRRLEAGRRRSPWAGARRRPIGSRRSSATASRPASARRSRTAAAPTRAKAPTPTDVPRPAGRTPADR